VSSSADKDIPGGDASRRDDRVVVDLRGDGEDDRTLDDDDSRREVVALVFVFESCDLEAGLDDEEAR
jgi:hypothetical protein